MEEFYILEHEVSQLAFLLVHYKRGAFAYQKPYFEYRTKKALTRSCNTDHTSPKRIRITALISLEIVFVK
jgi:hypothetical protein